MNKTYLMVTSVLVLGAFGLAACSETEATEDVNSNSWSITGDKQKDKSDKSGNVESKISVSAPGVDFNLEIDVDDD